MNNIQAPISIKMNLIINRPTTTITSEKATNQLKSLLLYSLINRVFDFPSICHPDHVDASNPTQMSQIRGISTYRQEERKKTSVKDMESRSAKSFSYFDNGKL